jgi:peptidoglycan/LPS O-acetylase OafA/YrhL
LLGALRFLLCTFVITTHLCGPGPLPVTGHLSVFAVFGFYALSGFLMTRVLHEVYQFDAWRFWTNRFLRLYPMAYIVMLATFPLVAMTCCAVQYVDASWLPRSDLRTWVGLILIFPIGLDDQTLYFRPIPSIWSVGVEIVCYGVLFIFTSRSKTLAWVTLALAIAYHVVSYATGQPWGMRYRPFYTAMLPFAAGALLYFYRSYACYRPSLLTAVLCIYAAILITAPFVPLLFEALFYANLVVLLAMIWLAMAPGSPVLRYDHFLGSLAYPMFIIHYQVGYLALMLFGAPDRGIVNFLEAYPLIILFSALLVFISNRFIEPARDRMRGRAGFYSSALNETSAISEPKTARLVHTPVRNV